MHAQQALPRAFAPGDNTRLEAAAANPAHRAAPVSSTGQMELPTLAPIHNITTVATRWMAPATSAHLDTIAPMDKLQLLVVKVSTQRMEPRASPAPLVSIVRMRLLVAASRAQPPPI